MGHWSKAERLLLRLHDSRTGFYQLSQVYLQQNRTLDALVTIRKARKMCLELDSLDKCPQECVRIVAQEGDVLHELGNFREAAEVRTKWKTIFKIAL